MVSRMSLRGNPVACYLFRGGGVVSEQTCPQNTPEAAPQTTQHVLAYDEAKCNQPVKCTSRAHIVIHTLDTQNRETAKHLAYDQAQCDQPLKSTSRVYAIMHTLDTQNRQITDRTNANCAVFFVHFWHRLCLTPAPPPLPPSLSAREQPWVIFHSLPPEPWIIF